MTKAKTAPGYEYIGKSRTYRNIKTGEVISRRQYDKLFKGIQSYEKKAAANKAADLSKALARPAHGRTRATSQEEIDQRLENARVAAETKLYNAAQKKADQAAKRARPKKLTKQALKTGHTVVYTEFTTWKQFEELRQQMLSQKLPNGRRLIPGYSMGIVGFDERTLRELTPTLWPMRSPTVKTTEDDLEDTKDEYIESKSYFIFSHYWLRAKYADEYTRARVARKNLKNIPKQHRKRK